MMGASLNNKEKTALLNNNSKPNENEKEKEHKGDVTFTNKNKYEKIEKPNEYSKDLKSHKKGILLLI